MLDKRYLQALLPAIEPIVIKTRERYGDQIRKIRTMQELYLKRESQHYNDSQIQIIRRYFRTVEHKFFLMLLHLEHIWALSMDSRWDLLKTLENSLDNITWDDTQASIGSMYLESYLFQTRAFINVFQFYICLIMNIENPGSMRRDSFSKNMKKAMKNPYFTERAEKILEYFENKIFGPGKWGQLLKELRDKISHMDFIKPVNYGGEKVLEKVLLKWPTLRGKTYDRFCQEFDTAIYDMFVTITPHLFSMEWVPGPLYTTE